MENWFNSTEALPWVVQRRYGCPFPGGVQGPVGWGPGRPDLVGGRPAHGSGLGTG